MMRFFHLLLVAQLLLPMQARAQSPLEPNLGLPTSYQVNILEMTGLGPHIGTTIIKHG